MKTQNSTRVQTEHGLTTRADSKKHRRLGPRTEIKFGPDTSSADTITGAGAEARTLMEYHREKAQTAISNALKRGSTREDAFRFARGHLLAGQKAQIQYQAELGWS